MRVTTVENDTKGNRQEDIYAGMDLGRAVPGAER